jgi:nitrous oxide reductase accessory protein NosL
MKKIVRSALLIGLLLACTSFVVAAGLDDVKTSPSCKYCGMDREKFGHSRMLITYDDGSSLGTCSLHCVATELASAIDKTPVSIQVADYGTRELIDAETAVWVLGGDKSGVMTARAKWAFAGRPAAEAFVKENGGTIVTFDESIKASYEDMYKDTKMIRERRKMKRMKQQAPGVVK